MKYASLFILLCFLTISCGSADNKVTTNFANTVKNINKWTAINGDWTAESYNLTGKKNKHWAIITLNKQLPENYTLTFSSQVQEGTYLLEVMLNIKEQAFLGILYNTLDKKLQIEDRKLFKGEEIIKENAFIRTKNNIGKLPKVALIPTTEWVTWQIQKIDNHLYIWLNNEEYFHYEDHTTHLQSRGQLGFAINGQATIKDLNITPLKGKTPPHPTDFKSKPVVLPFFLFSE